MKIGIIILGLMFLGSCHPLAMFKPKALPSTDLSKMGLAKGHVQIAIDKYGIPFIQASDLHTAVYGLGFMHARDRLFQLDLTRHAALGRLSELFGEKTLAQDRKLRVLTYKLPEQMSNLAPEERELLAAYARGVNDGARQRGKSAEHFLLGINFEEFSPEHVMAIGRLQAWTLGTDLMAEIGRLSIARSSLADNAKMEFFASVNDRGSAIMGNSPAPLNAFSWRWPAYLKKNANPTTKLPGETEIIQASDGASNAWAVSSHLTNDGQAVLMNDPHLRHTWPSNFYLATVQSGDMKASGATFVGLPSVLVGASDKISWGVTASYLNTQDAVLLKTDAKDPLGYWVDGRLMKLEPWPQKYCLNKKGQCTEETSYTSIFGPIIDKRFDNSLESSDKLAVQWTGFLIKEHVHIATNFVALARARNVREAASVVNAMTLPGVNLVLADTEGAIAFAYAGLIPRRDLNQPALLPLDGALASSLWAGVLPIAQKPQLIEPASGYIITANQNVFGAQTGPERAFGQQGAPPYRALQIMRRFEQLLARGQALDFEDLALIQLDNVSLEAQEISGYLGQACTQVFSGADAPRKAFAKHLANFDGHFTTDSLGALPFEMMIRELVEKKLGHAGAHQQISFVISNALRQEFNHQPTELFKTGSFADWLGSACEPAYQRVVKKATSTVWKWRWGRHHYLQRQSPLAQAPFIGGIFRDRKREIAGHASAPQAESGLPVIHGANLRFQAKMSTPVAIRVVIDSGNSGVVGHPNAFDQVTLWQTGKTLGMTTDWDQALKTAVFKFELPAN